VTVYGVVITLLLVFPWVLVVVPVVGAALSALARRRERSGKELVRMRARSAASRPASRGGERSVSGRPADDSRVGQYHGSVRRAA
jgi:peptidoglycan/LPS O-acetylase OafA/YrhL